MRNVTITVWKKDINGAQNGVTMFTRLFWQGLAVGLTAPATSGGKAFVRWEVDGVSQGAAKTIAVTMGGNERRYVRWLVASGVLAAGAAAYLTRPTDPVVVSCSIGDPLSVW